MTTKADKHRGRKRIELEDRTYIMGILNVTPDSFSDGGRYMDVEAALRHARKLIAEGADILDIGGESTRPGSVQVSAQEEMERILPVIERLSREADVPISVDTYKAEVAREALKLGADIINDVWGGAYDAAMLPTAVEFDCPIILMHNQTHEQYDNLMSDVKRVLSSLADRAMQAGVRREQIWIDPGIGFGKSRQHDLELLRHLDQICALGYPVLLGTSRKRVIRAVLDAGPEEVMEGTAATVALGIAKGCRIVRVHDVAPIKKTTRMADAIVRGRWPES